MLTYAHSNDAEHYSSIDYLECPRAFTSKLYVVSSVSCRKYTTQIFILQIFLQKKEGSRVASLRDVNH